MLPVDSVVLVADPYPPYQFQEGECVCGVDHDVIAAAFAEHGLKTITMLAPWEECLKVLDAGEAHGIFQIQRTAEREKAYVFSEVLRTAKTVFLTSRQKPIRFIDKSALEEIVARYFLGSVKGYSYDPFIDSLQPPSKVEVNSQEELLTCLSKGRIDLAVIDQGVASYLCHRLGIQNIVRAEGFEINRDLHVAFRKNLSELANIFNSGFSGIKSKDTIQKIFAKYQVSDEESLLRRR